MDVKLRPYRSPSDGQMGGVGKGGSVNPIDTFNKIWQKGVGMTYRHNNGCNMSFADGHIEHWRWKDKRTMKLMDGTSYDTEREDSSVNNADLNRLLPAIRGARDRQF